MAHLPYRLTIDSQKKAGSYGAMVFMAFLLTVSTGGAVAQANLGVGSMFALMGMSFSVLLPLIIDKDKRDDPFHPYSYFIFKLGIVQYLIPLLSIALVPVIIPDAPIHEIGSAAAVIALFFLFVYLGYKSRVGYWLARNIPFLVFPKSKTSINKVEKGAWLFYMIGWIARGSELSVGVTHFQSGFTGSTLTLVSSILTPLSQLCTLSFVLLVWVNLSHKKYRGKYIWLVTVSLLICEMSYGAIMGSRSDIIVPLVLFAVIFHKEVRHISWKTIVVGAVSVVFVIGPLTTVYRGAYMNYIQQRRVAAEGGQGIRAARTAADISVLLRGFAEGRYWELVTQIQSRLSARAEAVLLVMDKVPDNIGFKNGNTFLPGIFLNMVPRIAWSDKPKYTPGQQRAYTFWGKTSGVSMGIGVPAELYYNFNWLGLLLGSLFGIVLSFFEERYNYCEGLEYTSIIRYLFLLSTVIGLGHMVYYLADLVRSLIIYYFYMAATNRVVPTIVLPGLENS